MPIGDTYLDKVFNSRINLWRLNPVVRKYMLNPELARMAAELEGVDGLRVWHDQALIKEPYGNPTGWHIDQYGSFFTKNLISVWIALEDATIENGCMWFVPGSQNDVTYETTDIDHNIGSLFKLYPQLTEKDTVPSVLKAGDCGFHNGLVAHGAGANMTRKRRIAMSCTFMPIGCTYNGRQSVLPDDYVKTLSTGDVLANDDWNPVVYTRE